jgi:uncharacterized membrane protein required for colicin V production
MIINANLHLIDLIVIGLLAWGAYKGYKTGGIVQSVAVLGLITGLLVDLYLTKQTYFALIIQQSSIADLIAAIFLGFVFIAAIWFSRYIEGIAARKLSEAQKTLQERLVGLALGMVKYFIIIGIYSVMIYQIDIHSNFLPRAEKIAPAKGPKSILGTFSYRVTTTVLKSLEFNYNEPERPEEPIDDYIEPAKQDYDDSEF